MSTQYKTPFVEPGWAGSRETHPAVAMAIHAISSDSRTPEQIWEDPTTAEMDHVDMAVANYLDAGLFEAESDGRYPWGDGCVEINA